MFSNAGDQLGCSLSNNSCLLLQVHCRLLACSPCCFHGLSSLEYQTHTPGWHYQHFLYTVLGGPRGGGGGLDENIQLWNCRKFWTTPKSLCTSKLWCGIEDKGKCLRDKLLLLLPEVAKSKSTNKVQECWDCPVHIYWIDWFSTVGSCCWYCCCCSHKMVLPSFLVVRSCWVVEMLRILHSCYGFLQSCTNLALCSLK